MDSRKKAADNAVEIRGTGNNHEPMQMYEWRATDKNKKHVTSTPACPFSI